MTLFNICGPCAMASIYEFKLHVNAVRLTSRAALWLVFLKNQPARGQRGVPLAKSAWGFAHLYKGACLLVTPF